MKLIEGEKGFTLVETLVVINLSFIIISAVVSFYVLTNKYIIGMTRKFEERETTLDFFYKFEQLLTKSEYYSFCSNDTTSLIICSQDTVHFSETSIQSKKLIGLNSIKNYILKINLVGGDSLIVVNGKSEVLYLPGQDNAISSDSIKSIFLSIEKGKLFKCEIFNNPVPYKQFQNI